MIDFSELLGLLKHGEHEYVFVIKGKFFGPFNRIDMDGIIQYLEDKRKVS